MTLYEESLEHEEVKENLLKVGWRDGNQELKISEHAIINPLIHKTIRQKVRELNQELFLNLTPEDEEKVLDEVINVLEHSDEVLTLEYLKYGITLNIKGKNQNIKLIDYEDISKNYFFFLHEAKYEGFPEKIKPDFSLFVNGIPLTIIEVKKSELIGSHSEALRQIARYETYTPKLFNYVQLAVAYGDKKLYTPTMPRERGAHRTLPAFSWEIDGIFDLLIPERLLEVIKYFTFYIKLQEKGARRTKIIARHSQYRAVKKVMQRIHNYIEGKDTRKNGLIWHWQGSGKTFIMFFIANYFLNTYLKNYPVIFFVVDREQLERQHYSVFHAVEDTKFKNTLDKIASIDELKKKTESILKSQETKGVIPTGVYLTTIQKFRREEFRELIEDEKFSDKKEVLFLIDEAHRTQYGELAGTMRLIFKNAMFFGFSGTPVFKRTRNTFEHFAYVERGEYSLDVYFIGDSIKDGFTLPITHKVVEEGKIENNLTEDDIKALVEAYEEVGSGDIEAFLEGRRDLKITSKEVAQKLRKTKVLLESEKRIRQFAEYIADNIEADTENFTYKAMVVAVNRVACVKYKKILDEVLSERFGEEAKNWTEVVMTYQQNDKEEIEEFKAQLKKRFPKKSYEQINQIFQDNFLEKENPRILIVTDMLLTGFDAPMLKVMYLDKPLYEHRLLQAIARVNRPYGEKKYGLIVDSIGLIKYLMKTMHIYNLLAVKDERIIQDFEKNFIKTLDEKAEDFERSLKTLKSKLEKFGIHVDLILNLKKANKTEELKKEIENINAIVGKFALEYNKGVGEAVRFFNDLKEVILQYRALGSHPSKVLHHEEMKVIALIYSNFLRIIGAGKKKKPEFWNKILEYIHKNIDIAPFEEITKIKIEGIPTAEFEGNFEVAATFYRLQNLAKEKPGDPVYKLILERLKKLLEDWINRNITLHQFRNKLKELERDEKEYSETIKGKSREEVISNSIKFYIEKKKDFFGDITADDIQLDNFKTKLRKIRRMTPRAKRMLASALFEDLSPLMSHNLPELSREVDYIVEEFVIPMVRLYGQD